MNDICRHKLPRLSSLQALCMPSACISPALQISITMKIYDPRIQELGILRTTTTQTLICNFDKPTPCPFLCDATLTWPSRWEVAVTYYSLTNTCQEPSHVPQVGLLSYSTLLAHLAVRLSQHPAPNHRPHQQSSISHLPSSTAVEVARVAARYSSYMVHALINFSYFNSTYRSEDRAKGERNQDGCQVRVLCGICAASWNPWTLTPWTKSHHDMDPKSNGCHLSCY